MIKMADGYTLMHEHLTINLSDGDLGGADTDVLFRELRDLYRFGVRNIVDLTNQCMGRNPPVLRAAALASGINIIPSAGFSFMDLKRRIRAILACLELADAVAAGSLIRLTAP